jgi:pantoate--beta-alanine ligase
MRTVVSAGDLAAAIDEAKSAGKKIAFVPTMGALHAGHLSLIAAAQQRADFVVVSIFVNPLQFGADEDFDKYPRTIEADTERLANAGADLLFAPTVDVVYPDRTRGEIPKVTKSAGPVGEILEGAVRPGHFDGMLTVVARLFDLVQPDIAVFGAKDAQQLFLIRRMASADYPSLEIVEAPTVREPSGLAMSSRNRYLTAAQLELAEHLSAALQIAKATATTPEPSLESARTAMSKTPEAKLDYIALVDPDSFADIRDGFKGRALMLIAARVGETRLIDNIEIVF